MDYETGKLIEGLTQEIELLKEEVGKIKSEVGIKETTEKVVQEI